MAKVATLQSMTDHTPVGKMGKDNANGSRQICMMSRRGKFSTPRPLSRLTNSQSGRECTVMQMA